MCDVIDPVRVRLSPEERSVAQARRLVREHVCPFQDGRARETASLLVSELVTNAVTHGGPPIELAISCDDAHVLQVRVRDARPDLPTVVLPSPDDEGGRGLLLTALLSDDWGVDPDPPGKSVWFRLRHLRPDVDTRA